MVISFLYYDDRLCRLACCGVLRRKERQNGSGNGNQCFFSIHSWDVTVILLRETAVCPLNSY